ncbi:MAG: cysteine hydrolase family protein [Pseudomonadota bacterium]
MSTVLVVVDVQNAFFDGRMGPPVFGAAPMLARISHLLARARTQSVPVVFVQHGEDGSELDRSGPGWPLHADLQVRPGEPIIEKASPDSFYETDLAGVLDGHGASHLVITGNQTEFCIDTTCRAAKSRGYRVTLAADGHGTWDNPHLSAQQIIAHHNHVLGMGFADVVPSGAIAFS